MEVLYFLEGIRNPFWDRLMMLITNLGSETAFLAIALILFWCVNKRQGYYIMSVGFVGTILSQAMKILCRIPRPWVLDPEFTVVEGAMADAGGYSFPSGHSQSSVGTFGSIARTTESTVLRWVCIAIAVLVPFSRMYVGVHTPADVLVGSGISLVLIFLVHPIVYSDSSKAMPRFLGVMVAISVAYTLFTEFFPFPADTDPVNLASARKNAYTLLGALLGVALVYFVDCRKLHFDTKAVWWAQIFKTLLGLAVVLGVKAGLKAPLDALFGGHLAARAVRYFLVVAVAGIVWPMSFPFFGRLGGKKS